MNLDRLGGVFHGRFRCEKFGHGGLLAKRLLLVLQPGGMVSKKTGGGKIGCHIGDHPGNGLLTGNGVSKLDSFLGVSDRFIQRRLENTDGLGGNPNPAMIESGHGHDKAGSHLSKQIFPGYRTFLKNHFRCLGGPEPHFLEMHSRFQPGGVSGDDESTHAFFTYRFIRPAKDNVRVCQRTIGDEGFCPVHDITVPIANGRGRNCHDIGASSRLGQREGSHVLSLGQGNQVFFLLLLVSKEV